MQNTPKAPDYSALKGELDQVLVCVKDEGNVQNYKYKNLDEVKLRKGGKTIGELQDELQRLQEWVKKYEPLIKKIGDIATKLAVKGSEE